MARKILESCPSCGGELEIRELRCSWCETEIRSYFKPCDFCRLTEEQSTFLRLFVTSRGNLSEVEKRLGVSYPTVRAKLDEVIAPAGPGRAAPGHGPGRRRAEPEPEPPLRPRGGRPGRAQPGRGSPAAARDRRNAAMIENFEQLAAGATELQVRRQAGRPDRARQRGRRLAPRLAQRRGPGPARDPRGQPPAHRAAGRGLGAVRAPAHGPRADAPGSACARPSCAAATAASRSRASRATLQVHTGHGGATLRACRADVDLTTGHGNLTIERHRGRLSGHSGHGRLRVEGLEGDAELHTGHGNVDLVEAQGRIQLRTGHGRIEVVSTGGELDLHTGHGVGRPVEPALARRCGSRTATATSRSRAARCAARG